MTSPHTLPQRVLPPSLPSARLPTRLISAPPSDSVYRPTRSREHLYYPLAAYFRRSRSSAALARSLALLRAYLISSLCRARRYFPCHPLLSLSAVLPCLRRSSGPLTSSSLSSRGPPSLTLCYLRFSPSPRPNISVMFRQSRSRLFAQTELRTNHPLPTYLAPFSFRGEGKALFGATGTSTARVVLPPRFKLFLPPLLLSPSFLLSTFAFPTFFLAVHANRPRRVSVSLK